ncbi:MAG: hypothetical protein HOE53_03900 [Candidatus Magasanikbacteria bacterium]|nr:hypothetical protein [Candidatus Magasanikbacteria bacterium]
MKRYVLVLAILAGGVAGCDPGAEEEVNGGEGACESTDLRLQAGSEPLIIVLDGGDLLSVPAGGSTNLRIHVSQPLQFHLLSQNGSSVDLLLGERDDAEFIAMDDHDVMKTEEEMPEGDYDNRQVVDIGFAPQRYAVRLLYCASQ